MPVRIVNLTPHDVHLMMGARMHVFRASARPARVVLAPQKFGYVDTEDGPVAMRRLFAQQVQNLPPPAPRTYYIVSSMVACFNRDRRDLLIPHQVIRRDGRVVGCRDLVQI